VSDSIACIGSTSIILRRLLFQLTEKRIPIFFTELDEIDDVGGSSYTDDDEEDILNELLSTSLSQLM